MSQKPATPRRRAFDPESANRALPYVRPVVDDLVAAFARLTAAEEAKQKAVASKPGSQGRQAALRSSEDAIEAARTDMAKLVAELRAVGVELKDPATGLLDFPGEMDGRPVLFCWKRGEARVAWWHDREAGFRGRRPLPGMEAEAAAEAVPPAEPSVPPPAPAPGGTDPVSTTPPPTRRRAR